MRSNFGLGTRWCAGGAQEVKVRWLQELNTLFRGVLAEKTRAEEGRIHLGSFLRSSADLLEAF